MPNWISIKDIDISNIETHERIGHFRISIHPKGYRGIWLLGKILKQLPFFTGISPTFHIKVERLDSGINEFAVRLERYGGEEQRDYSGNPRKDYSHLLIFPQRQSESIYEKDFNDEPISLSGNYKYVLTISVFVFDESLEVLSFDAQSKDHFIGQIIIPAIISIVLSAIVSFVVTKLTH